VPSWFYLLVVAAGTFALACLVFALIVVTLNESHAEPVWANEEEELDQAA
jgi:hypothetical protein